MTYVDKMIWEKFHVKRHDTLPFTGWVGTRNTLIELFADLKYTKGAEIGVCKGEFSEVMCKTIPNLELLCIDPWHAYNRITDEHAEGRYKQAVQRLSPYTGAKIIMKTSEDAVLDVADESLDFVYIDGLHTFNVVMMDILLWSRKVKVDGIISGHDYYSFYQSGVVRAVDAYTFANNITNWYVVKEREPSWFWVKR